MGKYPRLLSSAVGIIFMIVAVWSFSPFGSKNGTPVASSTETPSPTTGPTDRPTSTLTPPPTQRPTSTLTPSPTHTPTLTSSLDTVEKVAMATVTALETRAWLRHDAENGEVPGRKEGYSSTYRTQVKVQDLIVSVRFYNPDETVEGTWSYGIYFRDNPGQWSYLVRVSSDSRWMVRFKEEG